MSSLLFPSGFVELEAVSEGIIALLDGHFSGWREARAELNELPLGAGEVGE